MDEIGAVGLRVLVGAHAIRWHLGDKAPVSEVVRRWRDHFPATIPLPHPSWRNTAWLKRNPWFEAEVVPALQTRVLEVLS